VLQVGSLSQFAGKVVGIERYRAIAITTSYVDTFFDTYLKDESPERLRAFRQKFPEVRALGK
jgi:hypothetical protein